MKKFLGKDVFLSNGTAQWLYHECASSQGIIDFHTHLPQEEILLDKRFENMWELWLKHDHYKWRLMRSVGIGERFITGDGSPYEKFLALACALPQAPRNPVVHWVQLELQRIFGIDEVLNEGTARKIWDECNRQLLNNSQLSVQGLLKLFNVEVLCTTDDPVSSLEIHKKLRDSTFKPQVFPTFRLDVVLNLQEAQNFVRWLVKLENLLDRELKSYDDFINALEVIHQSFHDVGCRLSDHGLPYCPTNRVSSKKLNSIFKESKQGIEQGKKNTEAFIFAVLQEIARLNTQKQWAMQWHLGPNRNNSVRRFSQLGADSGFDSMGGWLQTNRLIHFFSHLENSNALPKTIIYNLNPMESESLCCAVQSFQEAPFRGKMQYGPAWWHLDHKDGIVEQLKNLSNLGALGTFVGMLTDSRSFTSYVRHEYFRRILCDFIGADVEAGEIPNDENYLKSLIKNICYENARSYFSFPLKR